MFVREPFLAADEFLLHQPDVRRGAAETDQAQLEKHPRQFPQPLRLALGPGGFGLDFADYTHGLGN